MSIISDMNSIMLQVKEKVKKPSGASGEEWKDVKLIDISIYHTNDMKNTQSVRYNESTNTGITFYKDINKNVNRLKDGDTIYNITKVNTKGRFTTLLLKVVETNG